MISSKLHVRNVVILNKKVQSITFVLTIAIELFKSPSWTKFISIYLLDCGFNFYSSLRINFFSRSYADFPTTFKFFKCFFFTSSCSRLIYIFSALNSFPELQCNFSLLRLELNVLAVSILIKNLTIFVTFLF